MNKKISLVALLAGVSILSAQEAPEATPVVNIGGTKISMYGFVQLNAVYEDGTRESASYNWSEFAPSKAEDGEGSFMFNTNQTRIGINLSGPQKESGAEVSGRFETDFANNQERNAHGVGSAFRIRHAFGQLKFKDLGLTMMLGQANDLIGVLTAPTLNQGGLRSQGSIGTRRPMFRLTQALGPIEVSAAVTEDVNSSVMPAYQGSLKAKLPATWADEKQSVELTLAGHYAAEEVAARDSAGIAKKDKVGDGPTSWSGVASLSLPVIKVLNFSGEMFYGQNLQRYSRGSLNISAKTATGAELDKGIQSIGGWGALNLKLPAGFSLAGGLGVEAMDDNRKVLSTPSVPATESTAAIAAVNNPDKNMSIFANIKYNVAETVFVGFEYANLSTDYADRANGDEIKSGSLNRFELVFNYGFK